jgi:hypothetical protein
MRSTERGVAPRASFLNDLLTQVFSDRSRIDAERYCSYNGFLGLLLLAGGLALRVSGPPNPRGNFGFAIIMSSAVALIAAFIVPLARPGFVPRLLALQGLLILGLTLGFALACGAWALGHFETRSFGYLPGLITVGTMYGSAQWADFGPPRARPRPWRLAGFIMGVVLDALVAALLLASMLRR